MYRYIIIFERHYIIRICVYYSTRIRIRIRMQMRLLGMTVSDNGMFSFVNSVIVFTYQISEAHRCACVRFSVVVHRSVSVCVRDVKRNKPAYVILWVSVCEIFA